MNSEHLNTNPDSEPPDTAWDAFLLDDEHEPLPDVGDFWVETRDDES